MKRKKDGLTKRRVNYFLSKIYKLLYDDSCQVRWKKNLKYGGEECLALYDPAEADGDDIIWLSATGKNDLVNSIIHECLHALYNDFSEAEIELLADQICEKMSAVQYAHLIVALAENLKQHYPSDFKKGITS